MNKKSFYSIFQGEFHSMFIETNSSERYRTRPVDSNEHRMNYSTICCRPLHFNFRYFTDVVSTELDVIVPTWDDTQEVHGEANVC